MSDEYYSTLSNYPTKRDDIFKEKLKVRSISKNLEGSECIHTENAKKS